MKCVRRSIFRKEQRMQRLWSIPKRQRLRSIPKRQKLRSIPMMRKIPEMQSRVSGA